MRSTVTSALTIIVSFAAEYLLVNGQISEPQQPNVFQECNQTITESEGIIVSPNFTTNYPPNLRCSWTIIVKPGYTVGLEFWILAIERGVNCHRDSIALYDGYSSSAPEIGSFCGFFRPAPQLSTSNVMHILLETDGSVQHQGFSAFFYTAESGAASEGSCGGVLEKTEGSIQSPNFPTSDYPPSVSCSWHIRVPGSSSISISFEEFELERSNGCKYDSLVIRSNSNERVEKLCGDMDSLPENFDFPGDELFIVFTSDSSGVARGFVLDYMANEIDGADGGLSRVETSNAKTVPTTSTETPIKTTTTTVVTTTTISSPITTTTTITSTTECSVQCPKVRIKSRLCRTNYAAAIRITDVSDIQEGLTITASVIKPFKVVASSTQPTDVQIRLACPQCHKVKKSGDYVVVGNLVENLLVIQPEDFLSKYKAKKYGKAFPKWTKNCNRRRRRRRGHNRFRA